VGCPQHKFIQVGSLSLNVIFTCQIFVVIFNSEAGGGYFNMEKTPDKSFMQNLSPFIHQELYKRREIHPFKCFRAALINVIRD
jgi:hypothetical protein